MAGGERPSFDDALARIEAVLGYEFVDRPTVRSAFAHRSHASEADVDSYERLEFLGDAVLQLAVTQHLYRDHPELSEGEMAKVRAAVVNERTLAKVARTLGIPEALLLGRGESMTGGRNKDSILSDVVESMFGALYLEAGFDAACSVIMELFTPLVEDRAVAPGAKDFKTRLQELLAVDGRIPTYEVVGEGPEHAKQFEARVSSGGVLLGTGTGTSKKRAEQDAARRAYEELGGDA